MAPSVVELLVLEEACLIDLVLSLLEWVIIVVTDFWLIFSLKHWWILVNNSID